MFYIRTADKLQRTARWLENLPGGIKYLQEVILEDKLGICASLEAQMKELVASFFDEWAEAIKDPEMVAKFKQFQNTPDTVETVETEQDRGQSRPAYWPKDSAAQDFSGMGTQWSSMAWEPVMDAVYFDGADDMPNGISAAIKRGDTQLALWRFRGKYYATQQMCPHKRAFVLSEGLVGHNPSKSCSHDDGVENKDAAPAAAPWISCPHHKRNFDMKDGSCSNDSSLSIATFPVESRDDGLVYLQLPPVEELDAALGTTKWRVRKGEAGESPFAELDRKIQLVGRKARKVNGVKPVGNGTINTSSASEMARPVVVAGGGCGSAPDW
jgi:nitrite reductase (NAD(P)H)